MSRPMFLAATILTLGLCAASFYAGRHVQHEEDIDIIDGLVAHSMDCFERLREIPDCDCPGPEECDMEATCNRDGMRCCMELARREDP